MTRSIIRALPAAWLAMLAFPALGAPAAGEESTYRNDFRLGAFFVFYHTNADNFTGPFTPPGLNGKALDLQTLYIGYIRHFTPHLDLEITTGVPPLQKTEGIGPAKVGSVPFNGQTLASVRWFSPNALLEYVFLDPETKLRPFVGVGVNFTTFFDRKTTAEGNAVLGGPTKVSLSNSFGPAATAGLSYRLAQHWGLNISYSYARVNSVLRTDTVGIMRETHVRFGPQTLVISGGYAF